MGGWLHTEIKCRLRESIPDRVTHPSTNRAQRRSSLVDRDQRVTTTPNRYPDISLSFLITGPPNGPVLFCWLSSSSVTLPAGRRAHGRSARRRPGAWATGRLGGRPRTTGQSCYVPCLFRHYNFTLRDAPTVISRDF